MRELSVYTIIINPYYGVGSNLGCSKFLVACDCMPYLKHTVSHREMCLLLGLLQENVDFWEQILVKPQTKGEFL